MIGCHRRTRATSCFTCIVLYTEIDAQCDKLAVDRRQCFQLNWPMTDQFITLSVHFCRAKLKARCAYLRAMAKFSKSIYRVGQKSKLLILSEYVNNTETVGGMWTNTNSYRENEALSQSDIFKWTISRHNCFMFKYSMTESKQWNYC